MKHHELLDKIYWHWRRDNSGADGLQPMVDYRRALLEVVYLHKPEIQEHGQYEKCWNCNLLYPCPTIEAIEKVLSSQP